MSPKPRFNLAVHSLGWGALALSRQAKVSERTANYWFAGKFDPPERILVWLERLAAFHDANPAPERVRSEIVQSREGAL
jgi:hypothetical protein